MRIVFFGTPDAAVSILDSLVAIHEVVAVVTAPDRPRGRRLEVAGSPVKQAAKEAGIGVLQPPSLRRGRIPEWPAADIFIVAAYGLILPARVLSIPPRGCLNVHFSLLPQLRGAAPVQWALIQGLDHSGVTIMQMDEGLDTGPILAHVKEPITADDTAGTLERRLAHAGADLLIDTLQAVEAGTASPVPQDDAQATLAPSLKPSDARVDWSQTATEIANRVRAFNPNPGAWTMHGTRRIKIHRAAGHPSASRGPPGEILIPPKGDCRADEMLVVCGNEGVLVVEELQVEGKNRLAASDFLRGARLQGGERFE